MALRIAFTELFSLRHPIALAPMGGVSGGALAAAAGIPSGWPAKITGLTLLADRVRLDLDGQPPALVDVTPAAVAELSLSPGSQVWLSVKATDLEVYARADGRQGEG